MNDYRDNGTNLTDVRDVLFRCSASGLCRPSTILYGRECEYPIRGGDPCCPKCGGVMERVTDSDIEPLKREIDRLLGIIDRAYLVLSDAQMFRLTPESQKALEILAEAESKRPDYDQAHDTNGSERKEAT